MLKRAASAIAGISLWLAAGASLFLFVHAVIVDRTKPSTWDPEWLWSEPLVDQSSAATLALGFLALLGVRTQLRIGLRPLLNYDRQTITADRRHLVSADGQPTLVVNLYNTGLGPAVIRRVTYTIATRDGLTSSVEDIKCVDSILAEQGLVMDEHYILTGFAVGSAIQRESHRFVGEFTSNVRERLNRLDLEIAFEGILGEGQTKTIQCLSTRAVGDDAGGAPSPPNSTNADTEPPV